MASSRWAPVTATAALVALCASVVVGVGTVAGSTPDPEPPLQSAVLSQALPGFTAAPTGPTNGPLTATEFASQSSDPKQTEAQFAALAAQPGFGAFIRLWTDRGGPGNGANDLAALVFRIPVPRDAEAFTTGLLVPFEGSPGTSPFAVPSIPGARGFSIRVSSPVAATEQVVVFRAGRYVSMLQLASTTSAANTTPLTSTQAVTVSYRQYQLLQSVDPTGARSAPAPAPVHSTTATTVAPSAQGTSTVPTVLVAGAVVVLVAVGAGTIALRRRRIGPAGRRRDVDPWGPEGIFAAFGALDPRLDADDADGDRAPEIQASPGRPEPLRDVPAQTVPALVPSIDYGDRVEVGATADPART